MNPSQMPESSFLRLSGCRPDRHSLKSPMTETCFALVSFRPEEGEDNALAWREAHGFQVSVVDSEPSVGGFGIPYGFPTVAAPVDGRGGEHLDSEISSMRDCPNLLIKPPSFQFRAGLLSLVSKNG